MSQYKGFDGKKEIESEDEQLLAQLKDWHDEARKARQKYDWNWYLYHNFYIGNHYITFNRKTNTIVNPPKPKNQVRLTVNKIYSILRAIRNFATSYRPRWSVVATSTSEDKINNGKRSADTLDFYYTYLKIPKLVKDIALYMGKYGGGYFQYAWDDDIVGLDNQVGEMDVWVRDPYDVYVDPSGVITGDIQNGRYIDIAVSRPIQDIIQNKHYKTLSDGDVSPDNKYAASDFKNTMQLTQFTNGLGDSGELGTVILHETQYKKRVDVEVDGEKISTTEVWIATWVEGHLLRNEKTSRRKYNLIFVPSDNNPNDLFGEGYVKNIIPLVKAINRLESQILEYNNLVNIGRFIVDKNSGVNKFTNETGEFIEKNPGADVREASHTGLAPDIHQQINRLNGYIDEISGVKDSSLQGMTAGAVSGVAMESLKANTANNLQDFKDNLEDGLARLGEAILEEIALNVVSPRQIKAMKNGKADYFKIKGQVGVKPGEQLEEDTFVIGSNNNVSVVIGSDLAYTREGRIQRLDKMFEQGLIDQQTYLETLEFGDVDTIVERTNMEKFGKSLLDKMKSAPPVEPQQNAQPQQTQPQDDYMKLADDENKAMMGGQDIPSTQGAPKEHTAIHVAYSQSEEAQGDENLLQMLLTHIKGEEQAQGLKV